MKCPEMKKSSIMKYIIPEKLAPLSSKIPSNSNNPHPIELKVDGANKSSKRSKSLRRKISPEKYSKSLVITCP